MIIYSFSVGRFEYFNSEIDLDIHICVNCCYDTILFYFNEKNCNYQAHYSRNTEEVF